MLERHLARSGKPYLQYDKIPLNSKFDPESEATTFIKRAVGDRIPSAICIVGETLGYLCQAAARIYPMAKIVGICLSREIRRYVGEDFHNLRLLFADDASLERNFRPDVPEIDYDRVVVVSWGPSMRIWRSVAEWVLETLESSIRMATGSLMTQASFGPRWLSNLIRNIVRIETRPQFTISDKPIIAAASGPTLDRHLEGILAVRNDVEIWALPSSVGALRRASITPDLVITTDPGYYATAHLFRRQVRHVAMPLSAAPLPSGSDATVSLFAEGHGFEGDLLPALGVHPSAVPPAGTVAATAIRLAARCGARWILLAGLDLCYRDLRGHARPSLSAQLLEETAGRTRPYTTQLLAHAMDHAAERIAVDGAVIRRSPALDAYASWFDREAELGAEVTRLLPSPVATAGLPGLQPRQLESALRQAATGLAPAPAAQRQTVPAWPRLPARATALGAVVADWARKLHGASAGPTPPDELRDTAVWHLAHYCATAGLLRSRAAFRQREHWQPEWRAALQRCQRLVDNLEARVRAA